MAVNSEMERFIKDGYDRYADVKEAVTAFEEEIQNRLVQQLESKDDWVNFSPRRGDRGRGEAFTVGVWNKYGRQAIWVSNSDSLGHSVELGIRWNDPEPGRAVLYSRKWERRLKKLRLPGARPPLQHHDGALTIRIDESFDLETMAKLLLAETDRALANLKPSESEEPPEVGSSPPNRL